MSGPGQALSLDLRERVVSAYLEGGVRMVDLAARFGVGEATVKRWVRRHRTRGTLEPGPFYARKSIIDEAGEALIRAIISEKPDLTRLEITAAYNERVERPVSTSAIQRAIERIGLTRKKRLSMQRKGKPSE